MNRELAIPELFQALAEIRNFKDIIVERDRLYQAQFLALEKQTILALSASDKAVTKAEMAAEKRFEGINEFRKTLSDQAAHFMPRLECIAKLDAFSVKLEDLKKELIRRDEFQYRESGRGEERDITRARRIDTGHWVIGLAVAIFVGFMGVAIALFEK